MTNNVGGGSAPKNLLALPHVALVVGDLDRSTRFYCDLLGFEAEEAAAFEAPSALVATLFEMPGEVRVRARHIGREGFRIELIHFTGPSAAPSGRSPAMAEVGLAAIKINVQGVEGVLARVPEFGGRVLEASRVSHPLGGVMIFCTDPDQNRVELIEVRPA